ncbi:hypothetical protein [Nonomuraea typhae]|uniref:hypothetical protein n=1 Tax=Nonomuraea typhae TaxID=2603600 RepID=UPI0012F8C070|nr:hypothetical protein [Nonomuraea typhae]
MDNLSSIAQSAFPLGWTLVPAIGARPADPGGHDHPGHAIPATGGRENRPVTLRELSSP